MIVGRGQLAKCFQKYQLNDDICIFASGVSDSSCIYEKQFNREKKLLIDTLKNNSNKKFVYFSSCALSAENYPKNEYYEHKINMEDIIKKYSNKYYIFRLPQLFGDLILHKTLINFIYTSIKDNNKFNIYDESYRYVIEINDVKKIVEAFLTYNYNCITIDIANPHRYKVTYIVKIFENLLNKKANYSLIKKNDKYNLDLSILENFIKDKQIDIKFGEDYLITKLKEKLYK